LNCTILTASTKSQLQLYVAHNNSSSIWRIIRIAPVGLPQSHRCRTAQAQASLILSIPNYLPFRQGKSFDYEWVSILDVVVFKAPHKPFKQRTCLDRVSYYLPMDMISWTSSISQPEAHRCPQNGLIFLSSKMPELFEKSPLSRAKIHPDFQVTL
jgi:hypothetical protein